MNDAPLYEKFYILCKTLALINKNINIHFRFNFLNRQYIIQRGNTIFALNDDKSILISLRKIYIGSHTYLPKKINSHFMSGHHLMLPVIENRRSGLTANFCIVDNKLVTLFSTELRKKYLYELNCSVKSEKISMNNWMEILVENDPSISEDSVFTFIHYQKIKNEEQLMNYLFTKIFSEDELSKSYLLNSIDQLTKKVLSGVYL